MIAVKLMDRPNTPDWAGPEGLRAASAPSQDEGRVLGGRYRLLRKLGTGGMGTVWLSEHVALGRRCALKVLSAERAANPEYLKRFQQEARATSEITQENVVDVFDSGEDIGGEHYYVMEVLDGRTLGQVLREDGPLPVERALLLLEQVCRALAAAHGRGVVHCDVKPDNVLVQRLPDGREQAKLIDFGISRLPGTSRLTIEGQVIGTPEYMSPEQAAGDPVDPLTDVYATGVLAFELLTGCLPLVGPTAIATLVAHQTKIPDPPGRHRPELGPAVDQLVLRALAKRPGERFASMQAMANEVMRVRVLSSLASGQRPGPRPGQVETLPLPATPSAAFSRLEPPRPGTPAAPRPRWPGLLLALLGAAVVLVAAALAVGQWNRPAPAPQPVEAPVADEPPPPVDPKPIDVPAPPPKGVRPARPPPPAEAPTHDPYAPTDTLKADPFK